MKKIKRLASISLIVFVCSPIAMGYAENNKSVTEEITEQEKEEESSVITLTLSQAIEKALENNPEIKKSKLDLKKAEVDYREGNYDIRANKNQLYDEKETSIKYLSMVTALDFANKFSFENAKRRDEIIQNNIKSEVEELYFNLVQAEKVIDISKLNVDLTKKLVKISQAKLDLGLGVKQEVLNSELNQARTKGSYEQSVKNLENAKMLFNTKLGLETLQEIELVDRLEYKEFSVGELEEAIDQALKNRNEIKQLEFKYELEKLNMQIVKGQYPSITFMYRQQEVELEKAKKTLEDVKNSIEMEIRSSFKEIEQKKTEVDSASRTFELSEEGLRVAKLRYELGMGTSLEVDDAQIALNQAKLGLSNAILKYNLDALKFKTITGLGKMAGGM